MHSCLKKDTPCVGAQHYDFPNTVLNLGRCFFGGKPQRDALTQFFVFIGRTNPSGMKSRFFPGRCKRSARRRVQSEELCAGCRWSDDPPAGIKRDNRLFFDAVLGDQAGQIGPLDAHHRGGFALIAAGVPEVYLNKFFFKIVNRILQGHSVANAFNAGLGV